MWLKNIGQTVCPVCPHWIVSDLRTPTKLADLHGLGDLKIQDGEVSWTKVKMKMEYIKLVEVPTLFSMLGWV